MRVAFLGTSPFAVPTLEALLDSDHEVVGVVTGEDKPAGRGRGLKPTPVKIRALEAGLPVLTPARLKSPEFLDAYAAWKPDAAVVVAYRILPEVVFNLPPLGTLNLHPSLLPKYRGPAPLNWAIINGDKETGISVIRISQKVDAGGVVLQKKVPLYETDNTDTLARRLAPEGGQMIIEALEGLRNNSLKPIPQDEAMVTKAPKLAKEDGQIDWSKPADQIHNQVRGLYPWPGTYTSLDGKTLKLFDSSITDKVAGPGELVEAKESLIIGTGTTAIGFENIQLQGKKRMAIAEFIKGYNLVPGKVLGQA